MRLPSLPVVLLMLTQTTLWGVSLSTLGVTAPLLTAELGLPPGMAYAGVTIMFGLGAVTAPAASLFCERFGSYTALALGSLGFAAALLILATSQGLTTYFLAWVVFGVSVNFALTVASYSALVQTFGDAAGDSIATLTLATGLSSTLYWPISQMLVDAAGWRSTYFYYAVGVATLVTGIHAYMAWRHRKPPRPSAATPGATESFPAPLPHQRRRSLRLLGAAMAASAFVTSTVAIALIDIYVGMGSARVEAMAVASTLGIWLLAGRLLYMALRPRVSNGRLALGTFALQPLAFIALLCWTLLAGAASPLILLVTTLVFGLSSGVVSILRPVLVLELAGPRAYTHEWGNMSTLVNAASAVSPVVLGFILSISATVFVLVVIAVLAAAFGLILTVRPAIRQDVPGTLNKKQPL